ncbi:hypothetical protein SRABI128_01335 [Microbacterium sp. Bi128]|nr:hypothetical protein SRABI128_01335 [Microbacterium sp. Bi128]
MPGGARPGRVRSASRAAPYPIQAMHPKQADLGVIALSPSHSLFRKRARAPRNTAPRPAAAGRGARAGAQPNRAAASS